MRGSRTPGKLYAVRQQVPTLDWTVLQIDEAQGRAMRDRGEPHVYDFPSQAHAAKRRLNKVRRERLARNKAAFTWKRGELVWDPAKEGVVKMIAVVALLAALCCACGGVAEVASVGAPTEVWPEANGVVHAEGGVAHWLTFKGLTVVGGVITATVHVAPNSICPPIPPPTYGTMEVWVAPYQGVVKTPVGDGDWTLTPLQEETHYRVFAWYTDTCGTQHTSNEISFDTPSVQR